jgi:predicted metal-dependent peptidase
MSFDKLTPNQKIQAANIDCMRHPQFALLSGHICMGKSEVKLDVPTALTDGQNKYYGKTFIEGMNRKQLRYLVLHENGHVAYKHCVLPLYIELNKKFGHQICNVAADYVVNGLIEEMDPEFKFVERPTDSVLVDKKYQGMSYVQVLQQLLKEKEQNPDDPRFQEGNEFDEHVLSPEDLPQAEREKLEKMIDDANRQGELLVRKMRGDGKGGRDVFGTAQERQTNWKDALIDFIQTTCQGDENSRFCPPNKRLLASGFVMPSHFSETIGELVIACDTSGSMYPYYPLIFGEIARVCENVRPEKVRVLWWDTEVAGDQEFKPDEYDQIAKLMKPKGGGGTVVSCVAHYMKEKEIKAKALIMLTDGYIESDFVLPDLPILWGLVENDDFVPHTGKVMRIHQ